MEDKKERYVFVVQHSHERFDPMPFSIAKTWSEDKGLDITLYLMYDAVELLKDDYVNSHQDIRDLLDSLLDSGVPVYACGFCSRACSLAVDDYYPGVQLANRHIFYDLMTECQPINW